MSSTRASSLAIIASLCAAFIAVVVVNPAQAELVIRKIEPPNWWAGTAFSNIELLLTGENLQGLQAHTADDRIETRVDSVSENGSYAFLTLRLLAAVEPGELTIVLSNRHGQKQLGFPILEKPTEPGRYQGFGPEDVIYLVMPDRFADGDPGNNESLGSAKSPDRADPRARHGGDLAGLGQHLPYLRELGVTAVWLTPVYQNGAGQSYHGYWITDFFDVDRRLGTLAEYRHLVDAAHRAGIKVIQDQALNHTAFDHPWLKSPPTSRWWNGSLQDHQTNDFQIAALSDRHASRADQRRPVDGWFSDVLPDLNQEDPHVEKYLVQNSLWWVYATGVDGLRLDCYPYVPRSFWARWQRVIRSEFPKLTTAGEVFHDAPHAVAYFQGGQCGIDGIDTGLDTLFDFPLAAAIRGGARERIELRLTAVLR